VKIILISSSSDKVRTFSLNNWARVLLSVVLLGIPVAAGTLLGVKFADGRWQLLFDNSVGEMQNQLVVQQQQLNDGRQQVSDTLSSMTATLAQMRARLVRLDAMGEQLAEISGLQGGEFDFSAMPGLGGPKEKEFVSYRDTIENQEDLALLFASIENSIYHKQTQLEILRSTLADKRLTDESKLAGRPIIKGWMSSSYGMRTDPFDGKKRWHAGVDFAGRHGSDIIAVASGVVTWSGEKSGYGLMVEVNHSDGFLTRYAHNDENLAKLGTVVKKGDVIAKMGSSGRSTGPHVHFEVFKNGRVVDPATYIRRTNR
jgi:murein DD-endopeptidase MepM/ murein hydrolase activator NlpD